MKNQHALPLRCLATLLLLGALSAIALVAGPSSVCAEDEPRRGLLADGRAFRTDENGNQLVDYIAELEVNVESLEKRVYGLEDEVKEKQARIDQLQRGAQTSGGLEERDLVTNAVAQRCPSCPQCPEVAERDGSARAETEAQLVALTRSLAESRAKSERAERDLAEAQADLAEEREKAKGVRVGYSQDAERLAAQLFEVRKQLTSERENRAREVASYENALRKVEEPSKLSEQQIAILRKNIEESRQQLATELASRKKIEEQSEKLLEERQAEIETLKAQQQEMRTQSRLELAKLSDTHRATLKEKQDEVELLKAQQRETGMRGSKELAMLSISQQAALQKKQDEIDALQDRLTELQMTLAKTTLAKAQTRQDAAPRAAMAEVARPPATRVQLAPPSPVIPMTSSLVGARERAVAELRSQVSAGLAQLQMSIQSRDQLFAQFDQRGRALQIRPSPLRAPSGATPESIRNELAAATTVRDLVKLREDLRAISVKVADDIATVRRLNPSQR